MPTSNSIYKEEEEEYHHHPDEPFLFNQPKEFGRGDPAEIADTSIASLFVEGSVVSHNV